MNFQKFKERNPKQKALIAIMIAIVFMITGILFYQTFAFFASKRNIVAKNDFFSEYNQENINVLAYLDGQPSKIIPLKNSEYTVDKIECNNNSQGHWDYANWQLNLKNLTKTNTKCKIYFVKQYKETILNGADPVLKDGLIPVIIAGDGSVTKAKMGTQWYNYTNKIWANAVTLVNNSISYADGEIIQESNIESYFVWIPRYRYKIFNLGSYPDQGPIENKVQTIDVVFESKGQAISDGTSVGQYLTHPAFTAFNSNGMWVGKYESGYKGATTTAQAEVNTNDSSKLQIKPNVYSWRGIQVANAFTVSFNYRRNLDSHMLKNTEWGSVAYLQHSKYGSQASVRINNNTSNITGYSAINEPTCGYTAQNDDCNKNEETALNMDGNYTKKYNSSTGYLASTTGNISGIYDMSGGSWEYVMSVMMDKNGIPMSGRNSLYHSGFNGPFGCPTCDYDGSGKTTLTTGINFPDAKYYDVYAYDERDERYDRRTLGDATGEFGPFTTKMNGSVTPQNRRIGSWYGDEAWFVSNTYPWTMRGGSNNTGTGTGVFTFGNQFGETVLWIGFRIALSLS